MVRCSSKNGYHKDMCLKEIGVRTQNTIIILGSIMNIVENLYDHLMSMGVFTLIMNRALKWCSQNDQESDYGLALDLLIMSH